MSHSNLKMKTKISLFSLFTYKNMWDVIRQIVNVIRHEPCIPFQVVLFFAAIFFFKQKVLIFEPAQDKTYNKACTTSKAPDKPLHPSSMARALFYPCLVSPKAIEGTCNQQRLWSDQTEQMCRLICLWLHKSYCRFCHTLIHFSDFSTNTYVVGTHQKQCYNVENKSTACGCQPSAAVSFRNIKGMFDIFQQNF